MGCWHVHSVIIIVNAANKERLVLVNLVLLIYLERYKVVIYKSCLDCHSIMLRGITLKLLYLPIRKVMFPILFIKRNISSIGWLFSLSISTVIQPIQLTRYS